MIGHRFDYVCGSLYKAWRVTECFLLCNTANGQVTFPELSTRRFRIGSMDTGNGVRWDATNGAVISPGRGWLNVLHHQCWQANIDDEMVSHAYRRR